MGCQDYLPYGQLLWVTLLDVAYIWGLSNCIGNLDRIHSQLNSCKMFTLKKPHFICWIVTTQHCPMTLYWNHLLLSQKCISDIKANVLLYYCQMAAILFGPQCVSKVINGQFSPMSYLFGTVLFKNMFVLALCFQPAVSRCTCRLLLVVSLGTNFLNKSL